MSSGTAATWARDDGLRAIAWQRYTDPMNTWPEHERRHEKTIMGSRLVDDECLRCHLETVAAAKAQEQENELSLPIRPGDHIVALVEEVGNRTSVHFRRGESTIPIDHLWPSSVRPCMMQGVVELYSMVMYIAGAAGLDTKLVREDREHSKDKNRVTSVEVECFRPQNRSVV